MKRRYFAIFALALLLLPICSCTNKHTDGEERQPAVVAGQFYPEDGKELKEMISSFLLPSKPNHEKTLRALVVPHAGYIYSGRVAGIAYSEVNKPYRSGIIIASNHTAGGERFEIAGTKAKVFESPLGDTAVSERNEALLKDSLFSISKAPFSSHVIEVQLPFLKVVAPGIEIIPLITGAISQERIAEAAALLSPLIDSDTLLVVSSDLSHYHPYQKANELDRSCIKAIEQINLSEVAKCEACGLNAVQILLRIAKKRGWEGKILAYQNSGDTAGGRDSVVGYGAIGFYEVEKETELSAKEGKDKNTGNENTMITKEERKDLLTLSRRTVNAVVNKKIAPEVPGELAERLKQEERGCFVTLNKGGRLRGCIGRIEPQTSIAQCVIENSQSAALSDPRFPPVSPSELGQVKIEISVLSQPEELSYSNSSELLALIKPHQHGVIVSTLFHRATFLPQVWDELQDKEEFLTRLCLKAGLAEDCWKNPATKISVYEVEAFEEE